MKDFVCGSVCNLSFRFSDEEKCKCLSTVSRMIELARIAEENGILALESEVKIDSSFIKMCAELVLNNTTQDIYGKIVKYHILSNNSVGVELLEKLVVYESFLIISSNSPNRTEIVAAMLGAILGEKYLLDIEKMLKSVNKMAFDVDYLMEEYTSPLLDSENFENRLLNLTTLEFLYVLRIIDPITIATASKGCTKSFISQIKDGISDDEFTQICRLFRILEPHVQKKEILESQNLILEYIGQLAETGLIDK